MPKRRVINPSNFPVKGNLFWLWNWAISCKLWEFQEWVQAVGYTVIAILTVTQIWYSYKFTEYVDVLGSNYDKR